MSDSIPDMPAPVDLSLVETEQLIDALHARFSESAFVGRKPGVRGGSKDQVLRYWSGCSWTCAGLAESLKRAMLARLDGYATHQHDSERPVGDPSPSDPFPEDTEDTEDTEDG